MTGCFSLFLGPNETFADAAKFARTFLSGRDEWEVFSVQRESDCEYFAFCLNEKTKQYFVVIDNVVGGEERLQDDQISQSQCKKMLNTYKALKFERLPDIYI